MLQHASNKPQQWQSASSHLATEAAICVCVCAKAISQTRPGLHPSCPHVPKQHLRPGQVCTHHVSLATALCQSNTSNQPRFAPHWLSQQHPQHPTQQRSLAIDQVKFTLICGPGKVGLAKTVMSSQNPFSVSHASLSSAGAYAVQVSG